MAVSRRQFITAGAAAATAGCIPVRPLGFLVGTADASTGLGMSSGSLFSSSDNFRPHIGSSFSVATPQRSSVLTLTSVDDFRLPGTVAARRLKTPGAGFTLLFDGSKFDSFPQGTYTVRHAKIGTFDIFLAPVGMDTDVQAVINRLH